MRSLIVHVLLAPIRLLYLAVWRLRGWKLDNPLPDLPKMVAIGAPHTSNWDYYHMLAVVLGARRRPYVTVKHTLMRPPTGWFLQLVGTIPVDRTRSVRLVDQIAERIASEERILVVFTPDGTRGYRPHWRTGFYYTALNAGVPIVCAYVNYRDKRVGFGPPLYPSGDIEADFEKIRAIYEENGYGLYPENAAPPRLRSEVEDQSEVEGPEESRVP